MRERKRSNGGGWRRGKEAEDGDKSDGSMGGKREVRMIEGKRMEQWRMIRGKRGEKLEGKRREERKKEKQRRMMEKGERGRRWR